MRIVALSAILFAGFGLSTGFAAETGPAPSNKISVLIVDGMNNHDWPRGTALMKSILEASGLFNVDVTTSPTNGAPAGQWDQWRPAFAHYQVVVNNFNSGYKTNSPVGRVRSRRRSKIMFPAVAASSMSTPRTIPSRFGPRTTR